MSEGWLALLQQALSLLFSLDPDVWSIISVSFSVSFAALLITGVCMFISVAVVFDCFFPFPVYRANVKNLENLKRNTAINKHV